ncbi:glutathione peroxidase [Kaarinaea lacus]
MKSNRLFLLILFNLFAASMIPTAVMAESEMSCPDTLNFTKRTLAGEKEVNLCKEYLGKVVVVVNTASKCGYTYQYEGLEGLYRKYKDKGLVVIGFPSNDFGGQEPGTEKQIQDFCRLTYGVEFPMFEKTRVSRYNAGPVYKTLAKISGEYPQWNFHKYVLDRNGKLVASFNSKVEPQGNRMITTIEGLL